MFQPFPLFYIFVEEDFSTSSCPKLPLRSFDIWDGFMKAVKNLGKYFRINEKHAIAWICTWRIWKVNILSGKNGRNYTKINDWILQR